MFIRTLIVIAKEEEGGEGGGGGIGRGGRGGGGIKWPNVFTLWREITNYEKQNKDKHWIKYYSATRNECLLHTTI